MSYSYSAGTTTPSLGGLVEFGGIRINDGTFKTHHLGGLIDTPPVRSGVSEFPADHGGSASTPYYSPRDILLEGWIYVPVVDDLSAAMDQLRGAFALGDGSLKTLTF